jgi:transcriptional regulator with XRE-family HTH domain
MSELMTAPAALAYPRGVVVREQIRAGRALLDWNQRDLAAAAGVSLSTVKAFESGRDVRVSALAAIERALIEAGVVFLDPDRQGGRGVRFKR